MPLRCYFLVKRKAAMKNVRQTRKCVGPADDPWDVFELDDEVVEPEPVHGDFWGELDDDCNNGRG
jgi:hypothetical protein